MTTRSKRACLLLALLAACGGGSDFDSTFVLRTTSSATDPLSPIVVSGNWMVYLASEAFTGGTDMNGDGDAVDDVAVATRLGTTIEETLRAAIAAAIVGNEIFLVVEEGADGMDWDGDPMVDRTVLLHWSEAAGLTSFVDVLAPCAEPFGVGTRLYYASATAPAMGDETSLRYVEEADPTTPVPVDGAAGGGTLQPMPWGAADGLLFLGLDETVEARDLNGDGDATDAAVLGLLDGTDPAALVVNVGRALSGPNAPLAAASTGPGDWLVAFLVDEAGQGMLSLNDPGDFPQPILPDACAAVMDTDAMDEVLHYLEFAGFVAGMPDTLVSTGLAGRDRVLVVGDFVATLSDEADVACDLNGDGATDDVVARWVEATLPIAPPRLSSQLFALQTAVPGGSMGLTWLGGRLVAVVDEAADGRNLDMKAADHDLVGWVDPADGLGATWHFSHQRLTAGCPGSGDARCSHGTGIFDSNGVSEPFAGASWIAAEPMGGRLGIAFQEEVPGTNPAINSLNTNVDCNLVVKDADLTDSLPVWADFEGGPTLDFDGLGFAVEADNAGIVIAGNNVYFRLCEADDARDYNADGSADDVVLMRNPLTVCAPVPLATANDVDGPVLVTDGVRGGAFLSNETMADVDFNMDGDKNDLVVRHFLF